MSNSRRRVRLTAGDHPERERGSAPRRRNRKGLGLVGPETEEQRARTTARKAAINKAFQAKWDQQRGGARVQQGTRTAAIGAEPGPNQSAEARKTSKPKVADPKKPQTGQQDPSR